MLSKAFLVQLYPSGSFFMRALNSVIAAIPTFMLRMCFLQIRPLQDETVGEFHITIYFSSLDNCY